jgi:hypothetical protein
VTSPRGEDGQASVELVSLLPLAAVLLAVAWQAVLAGHAVWATGAAARAAARAAATGGDIRAAARARLDDDLEPGLAVRDAGGGTVEVGVRVPSLPGLPRLGRITATAHFAPQW